MMKDPMYSMIYHKPEHLVRLKWLWNRGNDG